jgi:hypothetical protein
MPIPYPMHHPPRSIAITVRTLTILAVLLSVSGAAAAQSSPAPSSPPTSIPATTSNGNTAGAPVSADPLAATTRGRGSRDHLTEAEISAATVTSNAFDLVRRLRPAWLRNRGASDQPDNDGSAVVQIWYNGRNLGGPEMLREISISQIVEMRYIDPIQARITYGPGNGRGVISITGR